MLVICDVTLYKLVPQCTNGFMNAPCCFSASTPEGLHDDKLLLVERRHSVVLRDSFCLTQMNLKPKNSAQNKESLYSRSWFTRGLKTWSTGVNKDSCVSIQIIP